MCAEAKLMQENTLEVVRAILKGDLTISPGDRARILAQLRGGPKTPEVDADPYAKLRILSRSKTADLLSKSLRFVDRLAEQGVLQRVTMPGRKRGAGFRQADVEALIGG